MDELTALSGFTYKHKNTAPSEVIWSIEPSDATLVRLCLDRQL